MKSIGGVIAEKGGVLPPLVFLRGDRELVFLAQPVHDLDEFDALCPAPDFKKYGVLTKDGWQPDPAAPAYLDELKHYRSKRWAYVVIKSLEPSKIEWSKVSPSDHSTWHFFSEELHSVLSYNEVGRLMALIEEANALDDEKLEANRLSFFQKQATAAMAAIESGRSGDRASTRSGEPASDSVSSPPA